MPFVLIQPTPQSHTVPLFYMSANNKGQDKQWVCHRYDL